MTHASQRRFAVRRPAAVGRRSGTSRNHGNSEPGISILATVGFIRVAAAGWPPFPKSARNFATGAAMPLDRVAIPLSSVGMSLAAATRRCRRRRRVDRPLPFSSAAFVLYRARLADWLTLSVMAGRCAGSCAPPDSAAGLQRIRPCSRLQAGSCVSRCTRRRRHSRAFGKPSADTTHLGAPVLRVNPGL